MTQTIDQTLAERGQRYGEFTDHADITQTIKAAMSLGNKWDDLDNDMRECLEMVAHKIGRILNGDPDYIDSWTDIIGYTRLVEKRLIAEQTPAKADQWDPEVIAAVKARNAESAPKDATSGGLGAFLAAIVARAEAQAEAAAEGKPTGDDCNDPTCIQHNPELAKAIEVLRRAGVLREV